MCLSFFNFHFISLLYFTTSHKLQRLKRSAIAIKVMAIIPIILSIVTVMQVTISEQIAKPLTVKKRVAIIPRFLATPVEYRSIWCGSKQCLCCWWNIKHVQLFFIYFIKQIHIVSWKCEVVERFETNWNLPQCAGAMDGSHICYAKSAKRRKIDIGICKASVSCIALYILCQSFTIEFLPE